MNNVNKRNIDGNQSRLLRSTLTIVKKRKPTNLLRQVLRNKMSKMTIDFHIDFHEDPFEVISKLYDYLTEDGICVARNTTENMVANIEMRLYYYQARGVVLAYPSYQAIINSIEANSSDASDDHGSADGDSSNSPNFLSEDEEIQAALADFIFLSYVFVFFPLSSYYSNGFDQNESVHTQVLARFLNVIKNPNTGLYDPQT